MGDLGACNCSSREVVLSRVNIWYAVYSFALLGVLMEILYQIDSLTE